MKTPLLGVQPPRRYGLANRLIIYDHGESEYRQEDEGETGSCCQLTGTEPLKGCFGRAFDEMRRCSIRYTGF